MVVGVEAPGWLALGALDLGPLEPPAQRRWRGNFYKCADESSHPHWASWRPIGEKLDFHTPEFFGEIGVKTEHADLSIRLSGN